MKNLSTVDYWNNATTNASILLPSNDPIRKWIESKEISFENIESCIEIGCYPGRFLTIFGDKGITLHGLDYVDNLIDVEINLKKLGYNTGEFINADIMNFIPNKKYDCVMSFGLIEHFKNWDEILEKHISLVEKDGYIILEVPNFRGLFQRIPRRLFDIENYKRHNIASMNLDKWINILKNNNFSIVSADYFGGYDVWFENEKIQQSTRKNRSKFLSLLNKMKKIIFPNEENNKHFSSYIGIIAKKND